jgi:hypothetical protein
MVLRLDILQIIIAPIKDESRLGHNGNGQLRQSVGNLERHD